MASLLKTFTSLARQASRTCLRSYRLDRTASSCNLKVFSSPTSSNILRNLDFNTSFRQFNTSSVLSTVRIQQTAPDFSGPAVVDGQFKDIQLSDFRGKYLVLFFYPLDFTFVCPTEIIAFSENIEKFCDLDTQVVGVSTDSQFSHLAWINTPRKDGGLGGLRYPLLSDFNKQISRDYDVLLEKEGVALRGLFIIDGEGIVRQMTVNDLPVGRSVDETLRLVQAFQFTDKHGEVCPANWKPESETIKPTPGGSKEYFQKVNK